MMRIVFLVLVTFSSARAIAQTPECKVKSDSLTHDMVVLIPEKPAQVVGGMPALAKAVNSKLILPASSCATNFSGIYVVFIVDEEGKIKGERVVRSTYRKPPRKCLRQSEVSPGSPLHVMENLCRPSTLCPFEFVSTSDRPGCIYSMKELNSAKPFM